MNPTDLARMYMLIHQAFPLSLGDRMILYWTAERIWKESNRKKD